MLAPIIRATIAASLVAGITVTTVLAAPRTPPSAVPVRVAAAPSDPATESAGPGSPTPSSLQTTAAAQDGGDLRSSGEGAGLAGSPLLAIGAVLAIGVGSAAATFAYVRLSAGRAGRAR